MKKTILLIILIALMTALTTILYQGKSSALDGLKYSTSEVTIFTNGVEKDFSVSVISDVHIAIEEKLNPPFDDFAKRMFQYGVRNFNIVENFLKSATKDNCNVAILLGDVINYPSPANISGLAKCIANSKVPTFYISGNHDWHFEGDVGSEEQMRARYLEALKPLYNGRNPMCYSEKINGVKFIFLDNSTYEISDFQLQFLKRELAENLPTVICAHIPFYTKNDSIFTCANPNWNAENDPYWEIERRPKWHQNGASKTTFLARDLIFSSPNVLGVFAGHTHKFAVDFYKGKFQIVLANRIPLKVYFEKSL